MRLLSAILLLVLLSACSSTGYFKVAPTNYRQEVKTLGVLPLLVDDGSTILHPDREGVAEVLRRNNAGKEQWLVDRLRGQKDYFDVRQVPGEPASLFARVVASSRIEGEGPARFRHYDFAAAGVEELCRQNGVDGLLVVIFNGLVRQEKHWDRDRTNLAFLKDDFNVVTASAAVVLPAGQVVWEYPGEPGRAFLDLQYADFDEAYYNATDKVRLHFVTLAGLDRILSRRESGLLAKSPLPQRYRDLFGALTQALEPGLLTQLNQLHPPSAPAR